MREYRLRARRQCEEQPVKQGNEKRRAASVLKLELRQPGRCDWCGRGTGVVCIDNASIERRERQSFITFIRHRVAMSRGKGKTDNGEGFEALSPRQDVDRRQRTKRIMLCRRSGGDGGRARAGERTRREGETAKNGD
jgi:hypothetical protein